MKLARDEHTSSSVWQATFHCSPSWCHPRAAISSQLRNLRKITFWDYSSRYTAARGRCTTTEHPLFKRKMFWSCCKFHQGFYQHNCRPIFSTTRILFCIYSILMEWYSNIFIEVQHIYNDMSKTRTGNFLYIWITNGQSGAHNIFSRILGKFQHFEVS